VAASIGHAQRLNREFWDALLGEGIDTFGPMHADSREDNPWRWMENPLRAAIYSSTLLLGDPSARIVESPNEMITERRAVVTLTPNASLTR
jgi:hypothetical protein